MAQYIITATSASKELTETNTVKPRVVNPGEDPTIKIPFPSPAEFETQEQAQAYANRFAKFLISEYVGETEDWVGHASLD
jgi:hypothetical protein